MSSSPTLTDPADRTRQRDEDAQYYRGILHELVEMATDIARAVHRQATTEHSADPTPATALPAPAPSPQQAIAFDRLARSIRRTIALARKLSEPDRAPPSSKLRADGCNECCPSPRQRRTDRAETDALHAEPCERPEEPDFDADEDLDDDLDDQSFADLIASLRHDSGLATLTDAQLRQHGTPRDVRDLCACAAQPRTVQPRTTQSRAVHPTTGTRAPLRRPCPPAPPPAPSTLIQADPDPGLRSQR